MNSIFLCMGIGFAVGLGIWGYCEAFRSATRELGP